MATPHLPVVILSLNEDLNSWRIVATPWLRKYEVWASYAKVDLMALSSAQAIAFVLEFTAEFEQTEGVAIGVPNLIPDYPIRYTSPFAVNWFLLGYPPEPTKTAALAYIKRNLRRK
jgi:hypothetical protein